MKRRGARVPRAILLVALVACAQPTLPPGGPPDAAPPRLIRVAPDSGAVRVNIGEAEFQFSEVIAEQPSGVSSLSQLILISPSSGDAEVRWRRSRLTVRPPGGWRENTTYVVTLLGGVADLRGNRRDTTTVLVFSTGERIPSTRLSGVMFDWARGDVAPRAFIQARPVDDTTIAYSTEADSVGRFSLPFLSPGEYVVRGIMDANRNRRVDGREIWDSARVTLRDSATVELYAFAQDTLAPRISSVTVVDSVTLRVALDGPLAPRPTLNGIAEIFTADSTPVRVTRVVPWGVLADERTARERAQRDSAERADTSAAAQAARDRRLRDSLNRAAAIADSIARDTSRRTPRPTPTRPQLITEVGIAIAEPLEPGVNHRLQLRVVGVLGGERVNLSIFSRPRPAPPPPARTDTSGTPGPFRSKPST